jgi:ABC-2 type transport system ATP-binding protein
VLRIDAVSFRYPGGAEPVLREVTLDMPSDGIFGLLGPNGAGKTTLISIIAGQLRGASGSVRADGEPIEELRRREPHSLGLVPQEFAFYPMLTAAENLRFFAGVQGLAGARLRERVESVAAFARIDSVLARRAGELSGGLKRRLNLAIGLLTEPRILLLDEPTVGVDPQSRSFLLESIRSLAAAGRTIVYTSHYMEEIQALCDHVAIIDAGRVLATAPLAALLRDDSGVVTLRLRAPGPDAVAQALAAAKAAGCETLAVDYGSRDLEQVFMQLTSRSLRD